MNACSAGTHGYWRGKPIEELSREELIEAVVTLGKLYNEALVRNINQNTNKAQEAAQ